MDSPDYFTLVPFSTPPTNFLGTILFLTYIFLALFSTVILTRSLYRQYIFMSSLLARDAALAAYKKTHTQHVKIFASLAALSFALLSYNMLMFLVTHYTKWCTKRGICGVHGPDWPVEELFMWMLNSTLFRDFARELVDNPVNMEISHTAVLGTWFWTIWMAEKAKRWRIGHKTMWWMLILSQILPISFTFCLFIVQLLVLTTFVQKPKPSDSSSTDTSSPAEHRMSLHVPNVLINLCLTFLPFLRDYSSLTGFVLLTRIILLIPHFDLVDLEHPALFHCFWVSAIWTGLSWGFSSNILWETKEIIMEQTSSTMWKKYALVMIVMDLLRGDVNGNLVVILEELMNLNFSATSLLGSLRYGGFAVKALGWDALFAVLVHAIFLSMGYGELDYELKSIQL